MAEVKSATVQPDPVQPDSEVENPLPKSKPQAEKTMGEMLGISKTNSTSNVMVNLFFNCPRSHSVPYSLKIGNDNAQTQWVIIQPGITTSIRFDIWERIKDHPDIVNFQEMGILRVIGETPDIDKAHNFNGVRAISQGRLVRGIDEPIPVTPVKNLVSTNSRIIE